MRGSDFLRFLLTLDGPHRRLAAEASVGLPRLQRRIKIDGLSKTLSAPTYPMSTPVLPEYDVLTGYGAVVNRVAGMRLVRATCLTRSVFLQRWLRSRNTETTLRIGIRTSEGPFAAHAWLEADGRPINDTAENVARYEPIADVALADGALFRAADVG
ncbi:lasso peptide biosynthesis B2 protein [Tropicimonas isoalkanivorans]|uniref:Transglutaminase-like superfamily protein n=1 Tax=Tropicimonas isoalkanivorans TaxID=441112 RepID=A0A1I1N3P5_9RHOB|nr:lasso peptide biosynthesis B2 protein [Tropicimonas isoalkanivorans]SFC92055.1 Transglutaminase-like superfamily protein [Tropicimonas isoalkanivorans]